MFVIVTGSRHAQPTNKTHTRIIWRALLDINRNQAGPHILYHGNAKGADNIAAAYAQHLGWSSLTHPAKWAAPCRDTCEPGHRRKWLPGRTMCPAAGVHRNQDMVDAALRAAWSEKDGCPELLDVVCLAFPLPGSVGTHDCARRAAAAGIRVNMHHLPGVGPPPPVRAAGMGLPAEPPGR